MDKSKKKTLQTLLIKEEVYLSILLIQSKFSVQRLPTPNPPSDHVGGGNALRTLQQYLGHAAWFGPATLSRPEPWLPITLQKPLNYQQPHGLSK